LVALADFPVHSAQPDNVSEFLEKLGNEVDEAIMYAGPSARVAGFVNKTSVASEFPF
jgi:hypothetical protein